jgi:uncharacterized protein
VKSLVPNPVYDLIWSTPLRRVFSAAAGALVLGLFALTVFKAWADRNYYAGYDSSIPLNVDIRGLDDSLGFDRLDLTFDGRAGDAVPTYLGLPNEGEPFPCVMFLHGIGQDKDFFDRIAPTFVEEGYAFVTFDQFTRGERRLASDNVFADAFGLRKRAALTVLETRRLVDYLETRPDIDAERIYLLGASFGAITGSTAAAFEPRIRATVLTYGGGDLQKLFDSPEARDGLGAAHGLVAGIVAFLMAPSDPVQYVAQIAPRPVLLQNGDADRIVPPSAARALQEAAAEPKEIVWYEGDHIGLDEDQVDRVLRDTIVWLRDH